MTRTPVIVTLMFLCGGCHILSTTPDRRLVAKFDDVDALAIASGDHSITVRDPDQIARLKQVYASAKWTPFIDTWPADLVSIAGMQGDEELFSLAFGAGSMLIERVGEKGPLRKSTLDEASANWLQELTRDPQWHD